MGLLFIVKCGTFKRIKVKVMESWEILLLSVLGYSIKYFPFFKAF
jgi:hypothetical protein